MSKLKHFKEFETYSEYETYINGKPMLPNVSFVGQDVYYKDGIPHPEDYFNFGVDSSEVESTDTSIINTYDTNYPSITFEFTGIVTAITDNNGNITANFNENTIEEQQIGSVIAKHNDTIVGTWTITQKAYEKPDYSKQYLTFKITKDGSISNQQGYTFYYSKDNGETWQGWSDEVLSVVSGDVILFKNELENYDHLFYSSTAGFEVYGNILSLIYSDDFISKTEISPSSAFIALFRSCTGLTSAENLILPATALTDYCYDSMFYDCTSLVNAPELPAEVLASNCYNSMFHGCTSLVNAPSLPATTLAQNCYRNMLHGCTSLVNAPELPATTLAYDCYNSMFYGCTSLVNAPELPVKALVDGCYNSMFRSCTSLATAPELPATALTDYCYNSMFYGCTSLNYIKCLAETNITTNNLTYWVNGVSSSGTFVKKSGVNWSTGDSGIPNGWTVEEV